MSSPDDSVRKMWWICRNNSPSMSKDSISKEAFVQILVLLQKKLSYRDFNQSIARETAITIWKSSNMCNGAKRAASAHGLSLPQFVTEIYSLLDRAYISSVVSIHHRQLWLHSTVRKKLFPVLFAKKFWRGSSKESHDSTTLLRRLAWCDQRSWGGALYHWRRWPLWTKAGNRCYRLFFQTATTSAKLRPHLCWAKSMPRVEEYRQRSDPCLDRWLQSRCNVTTYGHNPDNINMYWVSWTGRRFINRRRVWR